MVVSNNDLTFYVQLGSIIGTSVTIITVLVTRIYPWLRAKYDSRSVEKRVGAELYSAANIEQAIRYYVPPYCQDIDPSGGEEPRLVYGVRQKLFAALDDALTHPTEYRYLILLADSGMGKTSAMLNYYVRHMRRWRQRYKLALIPLGIPTADERISAIENKRETIIFLDALDEDTLAIVDHVERLRLLLNATREFHRVLISCRTQFFSKEEEIPKGTAILKVGSRAAGESAEYVFHKIYLSPFSDEQVATYLKKRYPIWRWRSRKQAQQMVKKIPHLAVRPMLLAHIDDILKARKALKYTHELYEEMVKAWLKREEGFIEEKENLRQFSEFLAKDLYFKREIRGTERVPKGALRELADKWHIPLDDWKLSGRSLLNRDAEGNYKFAHRSILEYLFVKRFFDGDRQCLDVDWTDQMQSFLWEILEMEVSVNKLLPFHNPSSPLYKIPLGERGSKLLISTAERHIKTLTLLPSILSVGLNVGGEGDVQTILLKCANQHLRTMMHNTPLWRVSLMPIASYPERGDRNKEVNIWPDILVPTSYILVNKAKSYMYAYHGDLDEVTLKILNIMHSHLSRDEYFDPFGKLNNKSILIMPINSEEKLVGMFVAQAPRKDAFLSSQIEILQSILTTVAHHL